MPKATVIDGEQNGYASGQIKLNGGLAVCCGQGWLKLEKLQLEGKKAMSAEDFIRGYQDLAGKILK